MAECVALPIALEPKKKNTIKGYTADEKLRVIARLLTQRGILNKAQLQPKVPRGIAFRWRWFSSCKCMRLIASEYGIFCEESNL